MTQLLNREESLKFLATAPPLATFPSLELGAPSSTGEPDPQIGSIQTTATLNRLWFQARPRTTSEFIRGSFPKLDPSDVYTQTVVESALNTVGYKKVPTGRGPDAEWVAPNAGPNIRFFRAPGSVEELRWKAILKSLLA